MGTSSRYLRAGLLPLSLAALLAAWLATGGCGVRTPQVAGLPEKVDFNFHVKPILSDRCFACHGPDEGARKAGLRLDTKEGAFGKLESGARAVTPGKPGRSELVRRILSDDPGYVMPTPESHLALSDYEKAVLVQWVEQGAEWKPHWSFIPPEKPDLPEIGDKRWVRDDLDRFVLDALEERGWKPSPEASKETLIRRVSLDLTGLPPTIEEIDAFLADRSPNAYEKVVDRLLASPAYGERMATEWLDVARYADSHGYQDDGMRNMWPWRDWVIDALNRNVPFDEFVTLQLAGDLLPQPTQEQLLATGFNRNHLQNQEGGIVLEEYRVEYVADRVNTLGKAFLGLTVECARCHDHKYDPILQKEFFQLFAFFNSVNETGNIPYVGEASPTVVLKDTLSEARLAELRAQIATLEAEADADNAAYDAGFAAWLRKVETSGTPLPVEPADPIVHLPLDEIRDGRLANLARSGARAFVAGDAEKPPKMVPGRFGGAQEMVGATYVEVERPVTFFERNQPFSVSFWVNVLQKGAEGPLFSRSAALFNGNRGYLCELRPDGRLEMSLNHTFPDNAIAVETVEPLPRGRWSHVAMTYDGSSRAEGVRLHLDGRELAVKVLVDNLEQSLLYVTDPKTGRRLDNAFEPGPLRIGFVGRDQTRLDRVSVDEFKVFDRRLSALEVAALAGSDRFSPTKAAPDPRRTADRLTALREHYVTRVAPGYPQALRRLTEVRGRENELLSALPEVMIMRDRAEPRPTYVLARGAYDAPTDPVRPGTPEAVLPFPDGLPKNRMGLAKWLFDPAHPLTARVLVNRHWQMFFGRGIVGTPDDFGNQGELPTHPELLDHLAIGFRESGWDLKALHRRIVTSATYRQSSAADPRMQEADPDNRWLARGPARRMSAEQIRDNVLAASGLLVRRIGGPSVYPYQPPGLWEELATRNATTYVQGTGDDLYRRSLYTVWKRSSPPPSAVSFDTPDRYLCTVARQRTSTPLQALVLLNDPQYVEAARVLAERLLREGGPTPGERITRAFRLLTSRPPSPKERSVLVELYDRQLAHFQQDPGAAARLLKVGEKPFDAALDPAKTAALATVTSTIANFDEAIYTR